jgi:hypothetical protein
MDAQSALRRCIELFSHNTRFFIIAEDKYNLMKPILSRFCEIFVSEPVINNKIVNLYQYNLQKVFKTKDLKTTQNNWLKKVPLFHKKIFEDYKVDVKFSLGAQYIIPKENILSKPLDFYELLHKQMLKFNNGLDANQEHFDDGVDAWMMEATWYEIFDPNRKLNINYKENLK